MAKTKSNWEMVDGVMRRKKGWEMVDGVMRRKKKATHQGGKKVTGKTPEPESRGTKLKRAARKHLTNVANPGASAGRKLAEKLGEFWDGS